MARPTTSAKLVKGAMTKARRNKRLEIEESLKGGKFNGTVPKSFTVEETKAYKWLCSVLAPADILGEPDRETVEQAAITIARLHQIDDLIRRQPELLTDKDVNTVRKTYVDQYIRYCKELCLSPGARSKIGSLMANSKKADDPLIKVLNA